VAIRWNLTSDKSIQASKDAKNKKEVKFENKTKTKGNALPSNSGIEHNFLASNP
jgi:hypothetical protein